MKNPSKPGLQLDDVVTPSGGYTAGVLYHYGAFSGVALLTTAAGEYNSLMLTGIYELAKVGSQAWAVGDQVFWDVANARATKDATAGRRIGTATEAVGSGAGDTLGMVRLEGTAMSSGLQTIRKRFTTAEVNAGATLLPAVAGQKYRMVDAKMIAIGGNAATATSVDILATQSASSVKLVAAAVAGIAQSVVARAGAANIAVLADGASFVANDVNTAVTIAKTGSNLATATHIDVIFDYVMEAA